MEVVEVVFYQKLEVQEEVVLNHGYCIVFDLVEVFDICVVEVGKEVHEI